MKRLGVAVALVLLVLAFTVPAFAGGLPFNPYVLEFELGSPVVTAHTIAPGEGPATVTMPAPAICVNGRIMVPVEALADLVGADVYAEGLSWSASVLNGFVRLTGEAGKPIKLYLFYRKLLPDVVPGAVTVERGGHLYVPVRILEILGGFDFVVDEPPCKVTAIRM
ncbi:hypothetical protein [Desulfofundulus thermocisternus]|uniref:hypothetical protein n=1 Tax=Desulfofundulus thermocisternus TaxID=42471 RepID=UPI0004880EDB|nr:hypothetical protein [Desulfofundulus thermocisternus]